jgi:hypothetical protein
MLVAGPAEAQKGVRQIEICSGWGGLGKPQNAVVTIQRKDNGFISNGRRISEMKVQALVAALSAPAIEKPDMTNLGVTPAWLTANVASQRPRAWAQATSTTANQQELFRKSFTNPELVAKVLPTLFAYIKSDDYPFSQVKVVFDDGTNLTAESHSYYVFMLPWKIGEQKSETYNADISRAVSALLPTKAVNKERLTGDVLSSQLTDAVMRSIEREWNLLGSDDRAGEALRRLRTSYEVVEAEITPYHHPEYGTATYKGEPEEMNLHASVRKSMFPPNVTDALVLRYADGKVEGVGKFLNSARKYESLALSVPWLNKYIRDNSRVAFRISYVQDYSFGDKAMRVFAADMKLRGRADLIEQVKAQQADIALLIVGNTYSEAYWLLFPDKHMMLWRYGGASGLLKWPREDFGKGQCSEYEDNYGGCSGREVTADGNIAREHAPQDQTCMAANRTTEAAPASAGDELFPVMDHGKGGFIDRAGKVIIPLCFDKVGDFSDGLARFERDGNWGYIDTNGSVVIEPKFPWAEEFSEGLARVQVSGSSLGIDGRWGFIDKTGNVVIAPSYKEGYGEKSNIGSDGPEDSFHDGLAKVEIDGKYGFIDKTGKVVIPAEFKYAHPFAEGLAAVTQSASGNDGWGYIDTTGKWVIARQFEWASSFLEGLAAVNRRHECGYIDRTGKLVLQPPLSSGEKDCATVWGDFSEGLSRWKVGKKYGYIDRAGKIVIEPKYDLTFHFSEGLAAVKTGGKWGYIDETGKMVIAPRKLFRVEDFRHGLAFVTTEDRDYGYIDKAGKYVWTLTRLYPD